MRRYLPGLIATTCLLLCGRTIGAQTPAVTLRAPATAVAGESWLNHLHRSFGDTSMGKTGRLGPPAPEVLESQPVFASGLPAGDPAMPAAVSGSDLYRLNCQACHGDAGLGSPPEINSLVNPVRATSVLLVMQRMKASGMDISSSAAAELANQSKAALRQRLHDGGENMPPFLHLNDAETHALLGYLNELAGVTRAAGAGSAVIEPALRIGEHVVKSTCHICHDATGRNPSPQELEDGAIPPLATLTARVDEVAFIRKVTSGAPIVMGTPATPHRGRMPVFYYITPQEAADAYLYLANVPPSDRTAAVTAATITTSGESPRGGPPTAGPHANPSLPINAGMATGQREGDPVVQEALVLGSLTAVVFALLLGGLLFSLHEFRRLSAAGAGIPSSAVSLRPRFTLPIWPKRQDEQNKLLCSPQKSA